MGLDEEFVKLCLKKMKASASRVKTLNSINIDPNYRDEVKKEIALELQKEMEEYVKTFDLLDKYFSNEKHHDLPVPSVQSIEKTMWEQPIINTEDLIIDRVTKKEKEENLLLDSNYPELISNVEINNESDKLNIEFDSIEELISDLEEKESASQQKLNIEYDTIEYIINDIEKDSASSRLMFEADTLDSNIEEQKTPYEEDKIEYLFNFYNKSINYSNIEDKIEDNKDDSIENFIETYLILKDKGDLLKRARDFVNIYQVLKQYKENVDTILSENKIHQKSNYLGKEKIIKKEYKEQETKKVDEIKKVLCPKCKNIVPYEEICEICGYVLIDDSKKYMNSHISTPKRDLAIKKSQITENKVQVQKSEIPYQVKQNNFKKIKIEEAQKTEYSQIERLAVDIISTYMDNFMIISGGISLISGLYLIFINLFTPNKVNEITSAMNVIVSVTDLLPGIFIPLYDLTLYRPNLIGIILSIVGLNLIIIVIGIRKGYNFLRLIGIITLFLAIYFDVIRVITIEYLITPWSIIGIVPNIIILYYLFNIESYNIPV